MPLPGTEVNVLDIAQGAGITSDTGTAFVIGQTPRGPLAPTLVESYGAMVRSHGERPANGVLHDAVETLFSTGLARAYIVRVVGPAAVRAAVALPGSPSGTSVTFTASSPGAWGNGLKVQVADAGSSRIRLVVTLDGDIVGQSPAFANRTDLLTWWSDVPASGPTGVRVYGTLAAGATNTLPAVAAAASATGGTDDTANVNAAAYQAALDRITGEHGTGQLIAPGVIDEDTHLALLEKGADPKCIRFAPLDVDPTWTAAQILAHDAILRDSGLGRYGCTVGPRVRVPAPGGGIRWAPASAFWGGRAAYTDAVEGPGQPPMGQGYGESTYVQDVEKTFTDDERDQLNDAGHIVIARVAGRPRIYGARTLADPISDPPAYKWVNGTRVVMRFVANGYGLLEQYVGRRVRGDRGILVDLSSGLSAMAEQERVDGNLFGETAAEAFLIDTRFPSVNSEASLADGWLKAYAEIRTPPVAERVQLNLAVRSSADTISGS